MTHRSEGVGIIEGAPRNESFAAVNSGRGFISFYKEIFGSPDVRRRYIIKGGPGTGKSSFMKRVAAEAEARGRSVEYYRCASDPGSLDGLIIKGAHGSVAIMDGTAPHVVEPVMAGAYDEIVDLGQFWDSDRLYENYNEIAALGALKSESYARAYKFLSGALNVKEVNDAIVGKAFLAEKMEGAVDRIFRNIPEGRGACVRYGIVNAFGMHGSAHLYSYEQTAKKLYTVFDCYGTGSRLLLYVLQCANAKGQSVRISVAPLEPDLPDAVYLEDIGIAFVLADESGEDGETGTRINMRRFIDDRVLSEKKSEYRINHRIFSALLDAARESLGEAGRYHFKLEKIYSGCMDFSAQNAFVEEFCRKLFAFSLKM